MKKVYVLGLLLFFTSGLMAQSSFKGGLKINPSFMWFKTEAENTTSNIENNGMYFGFSYGVFGDYYFAENYGISTELRIAHLGGEYTYTPADTSFSVKSVNRTINLQYIEIPVSLKMRTNEIGYMRYFGQFGFVPAINIKAKADDIYSNKAGSTTTVEDMKVSKEVNPLAMYLLIGAGVEYNLGGSTSLLGGITFHNGFTNIINKKPDDASVGRYSNFNAKPAYIALNFGVIF